MFELGHSEVSIRISGDELDPEKVTALLCCDPSEAYSKGDVVVGKNTGQERTTKTGRWSLKARQESPGDLSVQIESLLGKLTDDLSIWNDLAANFKIDAFCGLFLRGINGADTVSPELLSRLAERNIELALDIYDSSPDV